MKKILLLTALFAIGMASCESEETKNEDVVQTPTREGSVEVSATSSPYKDSTVVTLNYAVYKDKQLISNMVVNDTLPGLGSTVTEGEDSEGNAKEVVVPKQYEFYITVK